MNAHWMRSTRLACGALALCAVAGGSLAQAAVSADVLRDLPPTEAVRAAVLARPEVKAAAAAQRADAAEARRLRSGPHEWVVRLSGQQRRAQEADAQGISRGQRYTEGQMGLERTLRWFDKAEQDEALGQSLLGLAALRRADAIHEVSRSLLRAWYDWQRDRALVGLWQEQREVGERLVAMAGKRVRAGDAARIDLLNQEAALAQVEAELRLAQAREAATRAVLAQQLPAQLELAPRLQLPQRADLPAAADGASDGPASGAVPVVVSQLTAASHEARLAQLEAELARARAQRVALDQRADPSLGVFASSERGGSERVLGASVSLPLGGTYRQATEAQAWAQADQAGEVARGVHLKVQVESQATWALAQARIQAWDGAEQARQRQHQVLQTTIRGWDLGEFGQVDVQLARRQYIELARAEIDARAEARHAALRIWLDLHEVWDFDEE